MDEFFFYLRNYGYDLNYNTVLYNFINIWTKYIVVKFKNAKYIVYKEYNFKEM